MPRLRHWLALAVALTSSGVALGQFGPPPPPQSGPKLAPPKVYPAPGSYPTTESITFIAPEPGAQVHYTLDGSAPTAASPLYDPLRVLFIAGIYDGERGLKAGYTLRAIATMPDHKDSDILTAQYLIDRRDRDSYVSEEILPGVRMIRDSDNDKMFLIKGTRAYALIDSGLGRGKLRDYVSQFTGGLPVEVLFTHNHGDHIGQANEFIERSMLRIGAADRPGAVRSLQGKGVPDALIDSHLLGVADGERVDLGDRQLVVHATPGHTPGSVAILDEQSGYLFTGDSFGSNSPTIPDALWLQGSQVPLDGYLSVVRSVRARLAGRVKAVMTGHNDRPLLGERYLDNLEMALQKLMDQGEAALVPSYRPAGLQQVVVGERLTDPDWVAINVNRATFLPAPVEQIATLSFLGLDGSSLQSPFTPATREYVATAARGASSVRVTVTPTSSRAKQVSVNGRVLRAGANTRIALKGERTPLTIDVLAPDGTTSSRYTVTLQRQR